MARRKRKDVHFVFKAHPEGEVYMNRPLGPKTRVFVLEHGPGAPKELKISRELVERWAEDPAKISRTWSEFSSNAIRSGKKLLMGETLINESEIKRAMQLYSKQGRHLDRMLRDPTIRNIKAFFVTITQFGKFRHGLILRTIEEAIQEGHIPIESRYGATHSLLSRELSRRGIGSSREVAPQVFPWMDIVIRKLMVGASPRDIKRIEYKKAFISAFNQIKLNHHEMITGRTPYEMRHKDVLFYDAVETALINNLSGQQIDRIIKEYRKPLSGINHSLIFTLNGLPEKPTRRHLVGFMNEHSFFWQRQQAHYRKKRAAKKKMAQRPMPDNRKSR